MAVLPVAAVGAKVVGGIIASKEQKRIEAHIMDRVVKYRGADFPNERLEYIIKTYGGEMGAAAEIVLRERGSSGIPAVGPINISPVAASTPVNPEIPAIPGTDNNSAIMFAAFAIVALLFLSKRR
jgi:hypothetical protein